MNIETSEIVQALVAYAGPFDDPRVGWVGSNASRYDIFKCERCGAEHLDCTKIEHKEGCSAKALIDILEKLRPNVKVSGPEAASLPEGRARLLGWGADDNGETT